MIAIVVDSTVYMTREEARSLGAWVVPISYSVGDMRYYETYTDRNGPFEKLLAGNGAVECHTSQSTIAAFMSTFAELLEKGYDIVCMTISSRLSGTYSSASIAARELGSRRIAIFDSLTTAGGLWLLVRQARAFIDSGLSLDDLVRALQALREKVTIIFSVDDMTPLRKSGRLGFVRQSVGTVLNIRPLLLCADGIVTSMGSARGRHEQARQLAARITGRPGEIVLHGLGESKPVALLEDELRRLHPAARMMHRPLGPVLAIHLGLGVVGAAWMGD